MDYLFVAGLLAQAGFLGRQLQFWQITLHWIINSSHCSCSIPLLSQKLILLISPQYHLNIVLIPHTFHLRTAFTLVIYILPMQKSLDFDYIFKYILIGDSSVGKSTILSMFINGSYLSDSNPTMGVEFATKKLAVGDKVIKIQIWDTAGQESFRTITRAYYKNAIGIILVYDLNEPKSLETIDSWLKEISDNSNERAEVVLVGNKSDLLKSPPTNSPKPQFPFFTTSAKTGNNITKLFTGLSQRVLDKIDQGKIDVENTSGVKKGNPTGTRNLRLDQSRNVQGQANGKRCC